MHIYVVEDDNYARDRVTDLLRGLGHRVSLARAPADLMGLLHGETQPVDLILADLPSDRVEATRMTLRLVHRRYPAIPVVLRVSQAMLPATEALNCGVHGYLAKPFRAEELELLLLRLGERQASASLQDASGLYSH